MASLSRELRKQLENAVVAARRAAVAGAEKALTALRVGDAEAPADAQQQALRDELRAHGVQLGDKREGRAGKQETTRLVQACAYEHWHRMLFARFLAESGLLRSAEYGGVAMSLDEIKGLAREQSRDWLDLASDCAQQMLLEVFRPDDPVLRVVLPPETRQALEHLLKDLPPDIFAADDSLGWVYQFWQRDEKDRVNKSEVKIGADELSPVTQLFTEDYMVLFLLHNTLGAWWTAKRRAEGRSHELPGYEWTYLRVKEDGSPAAGLFEGWPRRVRDLTILDPCMGSGHFLSFVLPILVRMRMDEEGESLDEAVQRCLSENIFGLELDPRCSQIAAFNLAFVAWRLLERPTPLPAMNLACSGLGIHASEESWLALAGANRNVRFTLAQSYELFRKAPTLGSLIDPAGGRRSYVEFDQVWPVLEEALASEQRDSEARELAIAAKGVLIAARLLSRTFSLVATNVPYLGRGKHCDDLANHAQKYFPDAKSDLATCFVERCLRFCTSGGSAALVTPQNWLFLTSYTRLRRRLLSDFQWDMVIRLGTRAFDTITGEVVNVALLGLTKEAPSDTHTFMGLDVSAAPNTATKSAALNELDITFTAQNAQLETPDCRITFDAANTSKRLSDYGESYLGLGTGDAPHYVRKFWELPGVQNNWEFMQVADTTANGHGGLEHIVAWDFIEQRVDGMTNGERVQGHNQDYRGGKAWGHLGVAIALIRNLRVALYFGGLFDKSLAVIIPNEEHNLDAVASYCKSRSFSEEVRKLDQKLMVTNSTLIKVPFDEWAWRSEALDVDSWDKQRHNLTQWRFDGQTVASRDLPQLGVARLMGYRWPRQRGHDFPFAPSVEQGTSAPQTSDGITCLHATSGPGSAAGKLRTVLTDLIGEQWSATKLSELLGATESLDLWLRDVFFEGHCNLFDERPFVWHVWDGRKDGFHALVDYHRLAGPDGEGRKTLEKLIYTYLGDWITRQRDDVETGVDGSEGRLRAAEHLRSELIKILQGEPPYDIFVRWKPVHEQAIGWDPDLKDGVRLNLRPWLHAKPYCEPNQRLRQGACILRVTPIKLPLGKDRGKEPSRDAKDFPWFAETQDRDNDIHLTLEEKRGARERRTRKVEHDA